MMSGNAVAPDWNLKVEKFNGYANKGEMQSHQIGI